MKAAIIVSTLLALVAPAASAQKKGPEWAKGVPYTTDWDEAIKQVKETGKMLFIYNGWERAKI